MSSLSRNFSASRLLYSSLLIYERICADISYRLPSNSAMLFDKASSSSFLVDYTYFCEFLIKEMAPSALSLPSINIDASVNALIVFS